MKKLVALFILCLLASNYLAGQISHGGKPLPMTISNTRSVSLFQEMPPFNIAEQLLIDSLNESYLKSGSNFAYKFMTDFTPENSGTRFTLADGTRVWRLGIRSTGAYSINVLFSEYEIPEGAQLFLYNPEQTHVLGAFNHLNNSELGILPVAPVKGDELIIEYQEPPNASFHARLKVGEVNHDYRGLKGFGPQGDNSYLWCMPVLSCEQQNTDKYDEVGRSVVLLIINGITLCSGAMINNPDGKPYLLTASHCLNGRFTIKNPDYEKIAGNIVAFFNYDSPLCKLVMRGTEEMSVASAHFRATNEQTDMALLELCETPPVYYQPYYAGWNAKNQGTAPYVGIHHPWGSVKRINNVDNVELNTFATKEANFINNAHWLIKEWANGATEGGSSGSPLFDNNNLIIGGLSGGYEIRGCARPFNDFYFALSQSWDISSETDKQLKAWLDPAGTNATRTMQGFDPYSTTPCIRLSNIKESGKTDLIEVTTLNSSGNDPAFGNNSLGMNEFAEEYKITGNAKIYGIYIVNPAINNAQNIEVEINVYSGSDKPETLLYTQVFRPSFVTLEKDVFIDSVKPLNHDQESFIIFTEPVEVSETFFVGYKIKSSTSASFAAFNLPKGETSKNTAWIKNNGQWQEATAHPATPMSTSLFIDPVIQYYIASSNNAIGDNDPVRIFTESASKTINILVPETIDKARYSIFSTNGKLWQTGIIQAGQNTVTADAAPSGIYLIQITYSNDSYTQKILF